MVSGFSRAHTVDREILKLVSGNVYVLIMASRKCLKKNYILLLRADVQLRPQTRGTNTWGQYWSMLEGK